MRTPMQWSSDRNSGFSRANPQQLYLPVVIDPEFHFTSVNVEAQEKHASSFLWWIRRFIAMRKHHKVFGRGSIEILYSDNPKVFAFIRQYEEERVLMAVNLPGTHRLPGSIFRILRGMCPKRCSAGTSSKRSGSLRMLLPSALTAGTCFF